jgi:hypothetical protein
VTHAAPIQAADVSLANRLRQITDELEDIAECAADLEWNGVRHKVEAALGDLGSALLAAEQYEKGDR